MERAEASRLAAPGGPRSRRRALLLLVLVLAAGAAMNAPATAQGGPADRFFAGTDTTEESDERGWRSFFRHEGVVASFVHYRRADNHNSGVVLRLINENDFAVHYRLELAFLASDGEEDEWRTGRAEGLLEAGQMKTGSADGLFWVPFEGGRGIAEIRLASYQATAVE